MLYPREDRQWKALVGIMCRPELAVYARFLDLASLIENANEVNAVIAQWSTNVGKDEIYSLVAPTGCPVGLHADSQDLRNSPKLQSRRFFQEIDHSQAWQLTYAVRPYRFPDCRKGRSMPPSWASTTKRCFAEI